jgi:F-type H+-transporting ATPase subunit b
MKIMKEREDQIKEQYSMADKAKKEAEESKAIYTERVKYAEEEADLIIKKAHEDAKRLSDEIVTDADKKAAAIKEKAHSDIQKEKEKAHAELKKEIADISVDIAGKVVGREVDKADHERFIDEFVSGIDANNQSGEGKDD